MRRVRPFVALLLAVAAVGAWAGVADAVTGGTPDGAGHPSVGALMYPGTTLPVCSGTLVASRHYGAVFLTAAHCITAASGRSAYGRPVRVSFSSTIGPASRSYAGTYYGDPAYRGAAEDAHDLAVVVLRRRPLAPAVPLAPVGELSRPPRPKHPVFTVVGYGVPTLGVRQNAVEREHQLSAHWLTLTPAPRGPACYVDSGGPALLRADGATYVAATTIGGDEFCRRYDQDLRVDTSEAHRYVDEGH